jgi:hypothetical protein
MPSASHGFKNANVRGDLARPGHRIRGDREEGHGGAGDALGLLGRTVLR